MSQLNGTHTLTLNHSTLLAFSFFKMLSNFPMTTWSTPPPPRLHYSLEAARRCRKRCSSSLCKCTGKSTAPPTQWEAPAGLSAAAGITAAIYHNYLSPLKEAKLLLKEPEPNALCQCHNRSTSNVSGCGLACVKRILSNQDGRIGFLLYIWHLHHT